MPPLRSLRDPSRRSLRDPSRARLLALLVACPLALSGPLANALPRIPANPGGNPGGGPDPFAPGLVWRHAAEPSAAWMPWSVDLAANGELVWAGGAGAAPRWMLFPAAPSKSRVPVQAPRFQDALTLPVDGTLSVAGCSAPDRLFSTAQVSVGSSALSRSKVLRHDALKAASGSPFTARWIHDMGLVADGAPLLAATPDGMTVVCAVHDSSKGQLRVDRLDGKTGALLARRDLAAGTLRRIALAADGTRVALVAGADLWVLDGAGSSVHHEALSLSTHALALSGDGAVLVLGAGPVVRLLQAGPGGYTQVRTLGAPVGEYAARAAIARDASTLAVGWWNSVDGRSVRLEVWDGAGATRLAEIAQPGTPGSPQNFPSSVCVSPDGSRVAFGLWGAGDARPELIVWDRASAMVVLQEDLPGSVLSVALGADGRRIAVGMKQVHANQFGGTGEVRLYQTGEGDVAALEPPRLGRPLKVAGRRAGAKAMLFLVGLPSGQPHHLPGATGALWLDRGAPVQVFPAGVDAATGLAQATLPVGAGVGVHFAVQTVARVGGQVLLSECVLVPLVL